ncbi:hypothetical protein [Jannaschia donghaensis]|uniref:Uncharacterized protein n=1 Tax=Jannaschia donghaensis TaxID=420998 RepID=A0A0M6YPN2_9RHOB|nr:hypothetical protein [Jannaschia donghaensis]CTQ50976.1 hypothetical protein JDO7802_03007 [Jannaschia donghaensis]
MFRFFFTRILLFVIAVCGWGLVGFGGWIAWRGIYLYAGDPVLMGTGGGLAIGGLLVVALTLAARIQVVTAETARAILARLEATSPAKPAPPAGRSDPALTRR